MCITKISKCFCNFWKLFYHCYLGYNAVLFGEPQFLVERITFIFKVEEYVKQKPEEMFLQAELILLFNPKENGDIFPRNVGLSPSSRGVTTQEILHYAVTSARTSNATHSISLIFIRPGRKSFRTHYSRPDGQRAVYWTQLSHARGIWGSHSSSFPTYVHFKGSRGGAIPLLN
jgi:hypothetical protein